MKTLHDNKIRVLAISLLDYLENPDLSDTRHSWVDCFADWEKKEFSAELRDALSGEDWSEAQEVIECWEETAEIVSDKELLSGIQKSLEEIRRGETTSWEDVKKDLNLA